MTSFPLDGPYKGIAAFSTDDEPFFFGRDRERDLLYAHVRAARLTVLYGASGSGKSSLLQAGLVRHLTNVAKENMEMHGAPELAVASVRSWQGRPLDRVAEAVALAVPGMHVAEHSELADLLVSVTEFFNGTLLLLLDQFEEYLAEPRDMDLRFEIALANIVNVPGLRVRVLIVVQEEWLARLDRLEDQIPSLFANSVRLEHLAPNAKVEAIVRPLTIWNEANGIRDEHAYFVEEELVRLIRDHPPINKLTPTSIGIETSYMQLVLKRLWDEEERLHSIVLRCATLKALGGVQGILESYLDIAVAPFITEERRTTADLLRYLVTPFGEKVRLSISELATYTGLPPETILPILKRLQASRLVRAIGGDAARYEIVHQVLVPGILQWREKVDGERSAEKVAAERTKVRRERRRSLVLAALTTALIGVSLALVAIGFSLRRQYARAELAHASALARQAVTLRDDQFDLSLLLGLHAHRRGRDVTTEVPLDESLNASRAAGVFVGWMGGAVASTACTPDGATIMAADADGTVRWWSSHGARTLLGRAAVDWRPVLKVAFSRDSATVAAVAPDGVVRLWSIGNGFFPLDSLSVPNASAAALSADGRTTAVGRVDGAADLFRNGTLISAALPPGHSEIEALDFSPDGTRLVIGAADGSVWLWSATETRLMEPSGASVLSAAFSPDGRFFAVGASDGMVKLWSLVGRDWSRRSFESSGGRIQSIAFGPKSDIIAAACADGSIQVWSVFTGDPVGPAFRGHMSRMRSLSFMPDGRIVSGQEDGSVRLWTLGAAAGIPDADLPPDENLARLRSRVCEIANRNLSLPEWMQYIGSDAPYERECPQLPYGVGAGPRPRKGD